MHIYTWTRKLKKKKRFYGLFLKNKQTLFRHFQETQHTYAMQIGNSRVWDYVGDNFVHRLVQSKGDGKLVAVEDQHSSEMDGKADSLSLEVNVRDNYH